MNLNYIRKITFFTIKDELHSRSFYILAALSILFVLMLRGCFNSDMTINNQKLDAATIGWTASMVAFHIISGAGILIGMLLSMRVFQRDKDNGMMVSILSKPVNRFEYITGKTLGVWVLSYALVFMLHMTVYVIMLIKTGGAINWFLPASFLISLNVLFGVILVMLFSLFMPDFVAVLSGMTIVIISYISDSIYAISKTELVKSLIEQMQQSEIQIALWRIIWPKIAALQYFATSLIKDDVYYAPGPVHPVFNVVLFCAVIFLFLYWKFSKEEIK